MNTLVGYGSSDEDEDAAEVSQDQIAQAAAVHHLNDKVETQQEGVATGTSAPVAGPARPQSQPQDQLSDEPSASPNALRAQIQALTMPRFPNFDIPRSPSPPSANSEEAAELTARTRKFERFLELKKQGIHFNDRLETSAALANPQVLQKLAEFAGISAEEQYENSLGKELGVPTRWPPGFLEDLVATNMKKQRKDKESRTKLDFVTASKAKS